MNVLISLYVILISFQEHTRLTQALNEELHTANTALSEAVSGLDKLKAQAEAAQSSNESLQHQLSEALKDRDTLKAQNEEVESDLLNTQALLQAAEDALSQYEAEIAQLKEREDDVIAQLDDVALAYQECRSTLSATLAELQDTKDQHQSTVFSLEAQRTEAERLSEHVETVELSLAVAEGELESLVDRQLSLERSQVEEAMQADQQASDALLAQKAETSHLEAQVTALSQNLKLADNKKMEQQSQVTSLSSRCAELEHLITDFEAALQTAEKDKQAETALHDAAVNKLTKELCDVRSDIDSKQHDLDRMTAVLADLKDAHNAKSDELTHVQSILATTQDQLNAKNKGLAVLEANVADVELKLIEALDDLKMSKEEYDTNLSALSATHERERLQLDNKAIDLTTEVATLRSFLNDAADAAESNLQDLQSIQVTLDVKTKDIELLQSEVAQCRQDYNLVTQERDTQKTAFDQQISELTEMKAQNMTLSSKIDSVEEELKKSQDDLGEANQQLEEKSRQLKEGHVAIGRLNGSVESLTATVDEKDVELHDVRTSLSGQLATSKQKCDSLQSQIADQSQRMSDNSEQFEAKMLEMEEAAMAAHDESSKAITDAQAAEASALSKLSLAEEVISDLKDELASSLSLQALLEAGREAAAAEADRALSELIRSDEASDAIRADLKREVDLQTQRCLSCEETISDLKAQLMTAEETIRDLDNELQTMRHNWLKDQKRVQGIFETLKH